MKKNFASWIVTMLISLGTFAGVLTAMGTLAVPTANTVAAPAQSTATPVTPLSLATPPAGGRDDASFTEGSSSSPSSFVAGSDN
jgi:hypothetical protein